MYADQSVQYDATEEVSDLKEECDFYKESHNKLSEELQEIKSQVCCVAEIDCKQTLFITI